MVGTPYGVSSACVPDGLLIPSIELRISIGIPLKAGEKRRVQRIKIEK